MERTLKEKWIAALRSGDYEQASGVLQKLEPESGDTVGFCCLGVLVDIACPERWTRKQYVRRLNNEKKIHHHAGVRARAYDFVHECYSENEQVEEGELPMEIQELLGLTSTQCKTLMTLNDGTNTQDPQSFAEIANYIEEHL